MINADQLKSDILGILNEQVKDLWEQEDKQFLQELAHDVATQKILALTAADPTQHEENLRHLAAQLEGTVARKQLKLNQRGKELFVQVTRTVIQTVAGIALG